jgi:hypothetical protein
MPEKEESMLSSRIIPVMIILMMNQKQKGRVFGKDDCFVSAKVTWPSRR